MEITDTQHILQNGSAPTLRPCASCPLLPCLYIPWTRGSDDNGHVVNKPALSPGTPIPAIVCPIYAQKEWTVILCCLGAQRDHRPELQILLRDTSVEMALRRQRGHSGAPTQGPVQGPTHFSAATLGSHSHDLLLALCAATTVPRRSHSRLTPPAEAGRVATWSEACGSSNIHLRERGLGASITVVSQDSNPGQVEMCPSP